MKRITQQGFSAIEALLIVVIIGIIGGTGYYIYQQTRGDDQPAQSSGVSPDKQEDLGDGRIEVTSGQNGFTAIFPEYWGELIKPSDGDQLIKSGESQPDVDAGNTLKVVTTEGYGSDSPTVLVMYYGEAEVAPAEPGSMVSDFTIKGKGDIPAIQGKKYSYEYTADTARGLGERSKGDKSYLYLFKHNGKNIFITYNVYASDPANLIDEVDDIVQTMRINQ